MLLSALPQYPPKLLIYGAPGTGKTCFAATFGEGMEFIDLDGNLQSARTLKDKWTEQRHKIDVTPCHELDPFKALAWTKFSDRIRMITKLCQEKKYPMKCLCIDSFTALADSCLRMIKINTGVLTPDAKPGKLMGIQMWGMAIDEIHRVLTFVKALPIPVIVLFHDRQDTEGEGDNVVIHTRINIFGAQLPPKIIGMFDDVLRMKMRDVQGKPQPYLQTIPDAFTTIRSNSQIPNNFLCERGLRDLLSLIGWKEDSTQKPV